MTLDLIYKKFKYVIILILSITIYFETERQIKNYQIDIKSLDQERKSLIQKINQAKQEQGRREKTIAEFQQAQRLGLFSFNDPDHLTRALEQLSYRSGLKELNYQIKQVDIKYLKNVTLYWHKIILELEHPQDQAIFQFIEALPDKMPGLIIAEQLSLTRADPLLAEKDLNKEVSGFYHFYLVTFDSSAMSTP